MLKEEEEAWAGLRGRGCKKLQYFEIQNVHLFASRAIHLRSFVWHNLFLIAGIKAKAVVSVFAIRCKRTAYIWD